VILKFQPHSSRRGMPCWSWVRKKLESGN